MTDSSRRDALDRKHEHNREQRIQAVKRWVEYIRTHDPDDWGAQQNRLVNSQLESARESDIDVEHRLRVEKANQVFNEQLGEEDVDAWREHTPEDDHPSTEDGA